MEALLAALPAGGGGAVAAAVGGLAAAAAVAGVRMGNKERANTPPAVPSLPIIGNLLQLTEKKPHKTFAKWSDIYGPIYTIRTGASSVAVVNSTEVAKEAMVAKFSSISTRKLPKALSVLSRDKTMVATCDYGDFHKMVKRFVMAGLLGSSAQRQFRETRNMMMDNMLTTFHTLVADDPHAPRNFRQVFKEELFRLSLIQGLGEDVSSVYVKEFGRDISKDEIYQIIVADMMMCVTEIDWRDFFPYLSWIPNKSFDTAVATTESRRTTVMRALIDQQKERIARGKAKTSYLDFLLAENTLTDDQVTMLVWESIIEGADTTLVTTEWAMYELAKNPEKQDRLYREIQEVCGEDMVTEDHLPRLPYLNAVFHETLRRHSPVSLLPPRFVHETTTLAGYDVPAGTEVIVNVYACNMDKKEWEEPEEWRPERFLNDGRFDVADMYKTIAFGAGRRVCAGSAQATGISCAAMARFVQEFVWTLKEGDEDKVDTVQLMGYKLHPLYVYLSPRRGRQ
ncbi:ent-kaurene oxidase 2-like [Triticum dicoccoides]|nr:ent-kaurene oxidase 2-like [Triticum dicoccoides]XP_044453680.1 ent-kaurene oxidase 2-like [Triticum aestivum]